MSAYLDDQDLDAIVLRYQNLVYRLAYQQTGHASDADDIFQEVFIRLVRHAAKIQSEEHLKAWLIRVTLNCCNSFGSSTYRKKTVSYDDTRLSGDSGGGEDLLSDPALLKEDSYDVEHDTESIVQAVHRLPYDYRAVIFLFYYEDLSIAQIADALQISAGAVKTRLSRARKMLKNELKDLTSDA